MMLNSDGPIHKTIRIQHGEYVDAVQMLSYRGGNWQLLSDNWDKQEVVARRSGETLHWSVKIGGVSAFENYPKLKDAVAAVSDKLYRGKR